MTRTRTTRYVGIAAAVISLVASSVAMAFPPGPPVRSASSMASFAGTTFDRSQGENVDLDGTLHVVTQLSGSEADGWSLDWQVNVDRASGTGETSGGHYVLTGAESGSVAMPPGPPVRTALLEPTFRLFPPGPPVHPPSPIRFLVAVSYNEAGQIANVDVHIADAPPPTVD